MMDSSLVAFVSELRGACAAINAQAAGLCQPDLAPAALEGALRELQQRVEAIGRLCRAPELADLARLSDGLAVCLGGMLATGTSQQTPALLDPLVSLVDVTAGYLLRRAEGMETAGAFQRPKVGEEETLLRLEETLLSLGSQLLSPGEADAAPAEPMSAEDQEILRSFQQSPLGEPAPAQQARPTPGPPPAAPPAHPADELDIPLEMLELFQVETREDLTAFQAALAQVDAPEERTASVLEMRRIVHKIKGAASTLNLRVIASLAHLLEDVLDLLRNRRLHYAPAVVDVLIHGLTALEEAGQYPPDIEPPEDGLERLRVEYQVLLDTASHEQADDPAATQPDSRRLAVAARQPDDAESSDHADHPAELLRGQESWAQEREHFLRVDARRLDQLIDLIGELITSRAGTEQVQTEMNDAFAELHPALQRVSQLIGQLTEYESARAEAAQPTASSAGRAPQPPQAERQGNGPITLPLTASGSFSQPLISLRPANQAPMTREQALDLERYSEYDHLLRSLRESVNDVTTIGEGLHSLLTRLNELAKTQDTLTATIQHDLTHVRLVPLNQLLPRLHLTSRMMSQEQNKQITFQATGGATEIDRDIIEAISAPLVQLVRNCAVHGIESAEERRALGKPEVGTIWLHAYYSGNEISIELGDDGRGIHGQRLIETALASGKLTPEQAAALDPDEALSLILLPDISTSPEVTTISGRGMGMDLVRATIDRLKGSLHIHTTPGHGTTFHIRLPISLGILRALFVRADGQTYTIPFTAVERIALQASDHQGDHTAFFTLPQLLGITPLQTSKDGQAPTLPMQQPALIIPLGQGQVGVLIEEVLAEREIVVKPLPPHLRRRGVRGVTITPNGQLLLLLDLPELAHRALGGSWRQPRATDSYEKDRRMLEKTLASPVVMVVDDSLSMRRTLELQLTRAGYQVITAKDGQEALELLAGSQPNLLLLDIEMPRLDGYELLARLRRQGPFKHLPVAMLTSRAADIHRRHALELGADAYLVKPCPHDLLLGTVAELVKR